MYSIQSRLRPSLVTGLAATAAFGFASCSSGSSGGGGPRENFTSQINSAQELPAPIAGSAVTVTIRNQAPENGTFQTPIWVGFHDGQFDIYDTGSPASQFFPTNFSLERLAEDGNNGPITGDFIDQGFGTIQANLLGALGPAAGPIAPGEAVQRTFRLDPTNAQHRYFSYASMVIPSNDAFVANGGPMDHEIFNGAGVFTAANFSVLGSEALDAGTEVNDELPANTAFFGQATPDTGVDEIANVGPHPGFTPASMGGTAILDDAMFVNADFGTAGYEFLSFEFEDVATPALGSGVATYQLRNNRRLTYNINVSGLSGPATMMHLHRGLAGATGPVELDLFSSITENANGSLRAEGQMNLTQDQVDGLRLGELYLNIHTALNPAGELRGQVDAGAGSFSATMDTIQEIPTPALGSDVRVTVRNRAPQNGTLQTPVWVGFHDGQFDIYDTGSAASTFFPVTNGLERLAEDGSLADFNTTFDTLGFGAAQGALFGAAGPLAPGAISSEVFRLDPNSVEARYFSYASMVIPSNDAFIANGSPVAHAVFDAGGAFVAADFSVLGSEVLDAGTEVNDEDPTNTAAFGQMTPNTGVDEMGTVQPHPGLDAPTMGGMGILDTPAFVNADFTAMGYECLSVSLSEGPTPTAASGQALVSLNMAEDMLTFDINVSNLSGPATMLHFHNAAAGMTGPVELDIFSSVTTNADGQLTAAGTVAVTPAQVEFLNAGELYLNLHTDLNPAGEVRGQVTVIN